MAALPESIATQTTAEAGIPTEDALLSDASGLVSPPSVCLKLHGLIHSSNATAKDIGQVVALDPNLTARLLKIVNSSFYGFTSQIETVERATTILGTRDLYNLALAISAVRALSGLGKGLVPMDRFWRHSLFCALVARAIAQSTRLPEPERFFVAGLLHDIGSPVMYSQLPQWVDCVRERVGSAEGALCGVEREIFGFTHATFGARLLEAWQLPEALLEAIRLHHEGGDGLCAASVLAVADQIANRTQTGSLWECIHREEEVGSEESQAELCRTLGLDPGALDLTSMVETASQQLSELAGVFLR